MNTNPGIPFAKDLTKTMAATEDSEQDTFLGHGLGTNDEAVFTVEYRELSKSDVKGLGFAKYKWLKEREELLRGGTGYFAMAPIRDGADFFVGTVDGNANCFLANMEHHWATGANTYILKNARGGVVLAGLAACEAPPAIVVPGVSVRVDDSIGSDVHTTRDTDVDVHVTSSGRDCILVMEDKAGNQLRREALGSSVVNWELPAEDYVLFKASCRDTAYAKWATTFLVKDTEPPSVTIPALTAIQDDSVIFTAVAEDRYGVDYCLLELDAVGSKTFPARECVTTDNENFDCDSRTQFNSPEPTGLPKDRYTLLRFNVTCFDFNGNDGVARGAVYYYPEGVPIITVDTVNTPVTLVDEVYYYTKVGQPDLYIDASSTVGLTGCGIGGRNCLEVDCKSDGHGCYEAKYNCQGVTLSHGHNIIDVACVEFAAEGEVPQQLTAPFDFVYDEAPPVVTITPAKYDVTACTPATPRINITFTDSWFDDQEVDAARTTCTMALFKDVGGVRAETPMAHGYGDTLEASQPGEYTFESTLARAVDIANAISVTADGQADGDNVVVKCETTIHKTGDTGTETVGKMEANLKGMVPYDNVGTVLGGSAGKPVPVYLLPPGVAEATSMVERLGAYCYNNAYNASAKSADDDQACYYVDFSLLQGEISGDSLSVSLSDRGDVVKRGLGIGGSPTDCAGGSGDCAFKQKYSTGMRELMWFEDTGHVATDYPLERRHENNLHLGSGFSGETWPKYQRGIVTGKECGAVEALPNTDPDYDDLINPKALSFTAPEGEVFRGDTLEGLVCEGKDTEDNTLNAWISYTPESETSYLSMLAPHDGHPTPLPLRLALVDGMMATMAGEPFSFTPELTAAKGNYMLSCRIEDQDFMVSTTEASLPIKVKNNLPYVTSLAADPNPVYRTEATEVVCVGEDKEDLLTGASLKAAEIKYKRPTGTTPEKTWLGAAKYEADKGGYVASLTVPKDMGVGDYDLHCRLQDSEGDWGEWYEAIGALTVENIPPVINDIIYPEVILLDEPGTYDVNATDDDSSLTYAWDFGDTGTAKTKEASHSYTSTGKKTLSITVTDDQDASVTKTVEIYVMKEASGMGCYAACRYFDVGSTVTLSSPLKVRYSTGSDPGDTDTLRIDVASGCTATEMGADEVWQDMGKDDARKDNGQWEHCACGLGLKLTCGNGGAKCSYPMEGYTDCDWNFVTSISTVSTKGSAMDPPQPTLFWGRFKEDVSTGSQSFRYIRACAPAACLDYMSIAIAADISYTEVDADTTPPSFNGIEKLEVSYSFGTVSRIDLTWKAATDAHPPIKYIIYEKIGDGGYTEAGKTSILSYSEKYPDCDDGCSYKVLAMDKYGNKGSLADAEAKSVSATKEGLLGLGKWCWSNDACASGFCDFTVGVGTSYGECLCDEDSDCPDDYPYCGTAGDENECVKISCEAYAIDYIARHLPENPASYGFTCKGSSDSSYDYCFSGVGECSWPSRYCCWNV
ncbi:MAG: PKD domain-containing protein [Candidatus Diapherotrites archaeon]|nr:PKD domain-containing protein [Candidatus Diapherotrites archaeon]